MLEAINLIYTNKSLRSSGLVECIKDGEWVFKAALSATNNKIPYTRTLIKEKEKRLENKINLQNIKKEEIELPILVLNLFQNCLPLLQTEPHDNFDLHLLGILINL